MAANTQNVPFEGNGGAMDGQAEAEDEGQAYEDAVDTTIVNQGLDNFSSILSSFHENMQRHLEDAIAIMAAAGELSEEVEQQQEAERRRAQQAMDYVHSFQ